MDFNPRAHTHTHTHTHTQIGPLSLMTLATLPSRVFTRLSSSRRLLSSSFSWIFSCFLMNSSLVSPSISYETRISNLHTDEFRYLLVPRYFRSLWMRIHLFLSEVGVGWYRESLLSTSNFSGSFPPRFGIVE